MATRAKADNQTVWGGSGVDVMEVGMVEMGMRGSSSRRDGEKLVCRERREQRQPVGGGRRHDTLEGSKQELHA